METLMQEALLQEALMQEAVTEETLMDRLVDRLGPGLGIEEECPGCGTEILLAAGAGGELSVACACSSAAALV
jgi:hypothetical protein